MRRTRIFFLFPRALSAAPMIFWPRYESRRHRIIHPAQLQHLFSAPSNCIYHRFMNALLPLVLPSSDIESASPSKFRFMFHPAR